MNVYLDHAATTPCDPRALEAMLPFFSEQYGNPSSIYTLGTQAADALWKARVGVGDALRCKPQEIIFCGSGTESDNLAVFGVARAYSDKGKHLITSAIEHHAVGSAFDRLQEEGYSVTVLPVDAHGTVDPRAVAAALRPDTTLVSIMYGNNEVGTIQDIAAIGKICRGADVFLHTDACQAAGALTLDTQKLQVDLMTINGSKIYGPKGIGVLYKRAGVRLVPLLVGGYQEMGMRAGTENVAGAVGLSVALVSANKIRASESERLIALRTYAFDALQDNIDGVTPNGHLENRLPNNIHVSIAGVEGEAIVLYASERGVYLSTGSACNMRQQSSSSSHVLRAIGLSEDASRASIRLTMGRSTTKEGIDYAVDTLAYIIKRLRSV